MVTRSGDLWDFSSKGWGVKPQCSREPRGGTRSSSLLRPSEEPAGNWVVIVVQFDRRLFALGPPGAKNPRRARKLCYEKRVDESLSEEGHRPLLAVKGAIVCRERSPSLEKTFLSRLGKISVFSEIFITCFLVRSCCHRYVPLILYHQNPRLG